MFSEYLSKCFFLTEISEKECSLLFIYVDYNLGMDTTPVYCCLLSYNGLILAKLQLYSKRSLDTLEELQRFTPQVEGGHF